MLAELKDHMRVSLPPRVLKNGGLYWASDKMKERLTAKVKKKSGKGTEPLPLYLAHGQKDEQGRELIAVPRNCCPVPQGNRDQRSRGKRTVFISTVKPLDDDQAFFIKRGKQLIREGLSFVAKAPTGFGKTVVTMPLIAQARTTTLIVVHKEDIEDQWRDALTKFLKLKPSDIGLVKGDICNYKDKKVVIAYVQSICKKDRYPEALYKYFGLVIFDEVHKLGAEEFSQTAWRFSAYQVVGLSATPYRKDGRDILITAHIGTIMIDIKQIQLVPKIIAAHTRYQIPLVPRWNPEKGRQEMVLMPHDAGRLGGLIKHMREDKARNAIICDFIKKCVDHGRYSIIFSENKDHLKILFEQLVTYGIPRHEIAYYVGGMSKKQRDEAKKKKVCLATYAMTESATDNPIWSVGVMATPRADVNQIIGRVLRRHDSKCCALNPEEGKKIPIVLDLIDDSSKVLLGYFGSRKKYYDSIKAPMIA